MIKLIKVLRCFLSLVEKYPFLSFLLFALAVVALIVYVAIFFIKAQTIIFAMYLALGLSSLLVVGLTLMVFLHVLKNHSKTQALRTDDSV